MMNKLEKRLSKKVRVLQAKLKIADRVLRYYGEQNVWKYRGVQKMLGGSAHLACFYTSFEPSTPREGWAWAQDALQEMAQIGVRK